MAVSLNRKAIRSLFSLFSCQRARPSTGRVEGLRARGGLEVDLSWSSGRLDEALIQNEVGPAQDLVIRYGPRLLALHLAPGDSATLTFDRFGDEGDITPQ